MRTTTFVRLASCLLLVSWLFTARTMAQTSGTGALTITATDTTNSAIPGATVTVTSIGTGAARSQTTEGNVGATFTLLQPGAYKVTISAPGFKGVEISPVDVNVSETHAFSAKLEVGAQQQEVTVTAGTDAVKTETSTLGDVVGSRQINDIPLVTRNYTQILGLSPGAVMDVNNASAVGRGSQYTYTNGLGNASNNYLMDGASVTIYANGATNDPTTYFGSIPIPSPDALGEFKVQTSLYDAGYGRNAGASVNVITKSGTNELHGSLFEFIRNDDLNANDFFANRAGQDRPVLKQNQFGGTVGGPVLKDKLFYFLSYEGTRQLNGLDTHGHSTVSLPPQLTNDRSAAALGSEFCAPNHPAGTPGAKYTNTFGGGTPLACDGSNINPVALNILNAKLPNGALAIPAPQTILNPGTANAIGFSYLVDPSRFSEDQAMFNMDYLLSTKHTISGRYFFATANQLNGFGSCSPGCLPGSGQSPITGNHVANIRLTSALSPTLVNEVRFSYYHIRAGVDTTDPLTAAAVGITPPAPWYPTLSPLTFVSPALNFGGSTVDGARQPQDYYEWSDQLSWSRGKHTVRVGFGGQRVDWLSISYASDRGALTFQTFPDFLLGLSAAQNGSSFSNVYSTTAGVNPTGGAVLNLRNNNSYAFLQDDVKVTPRLTFNLGVRWDYLGLEYDALRSNGGFDPWWTLLNTVPVPPAGGTYVGYTVAHNYTGVVPQGVVQRGVDVANQNGSPHNNFSPRIGFAWQPLNTSKLVVRGGYGWYYNMINGTPQIFNQTADPTIAQTISRAGAANAAATLQNPYNLQAPGWTSALRTLTSTLAFNAVDQYLVNPLIQSYNFNIQYSLTKSMALEVGYVGNRGEHLATGEALNVAQLASPTSPVNCGLPAGCITTNTAANASQRVPVIGINSGGITNLANVGDSSYNSLQTSLRKNFSHGLQFQAAYTYGRAFTDIAGLAFTSGTSGTVNSNDPNNRAQQRAPADFNRPHRLVINYSYELPGFRKGSGFAGKALTGWGIAGVTTVQSGLPLTLTDSRGGQAYGIATSRAQICAGQTYSSLVSPGGLESNLSSYFNVGAFCPVPIVGQVNGVGGATGFGNTARSILLGPGQKNFDAVISKRTTVGGIHEGAYVEFRAEFFNVFNHPQFSNPATNVAASTFGLINSTSVAPRIIQFALRYAF
jgi:Carboxypeptidase regulatory-like domain/TonB dependent receptor